MVSLEIKTVTSGSSAAISFSAFKVSDAVSFILNWVCTSVTTEP